MFDRRQGLDSQIAATAISHGMAVVTCNVADMAHTGASVVSPFEQQTGTP